MTDARSIHLSVPTIVKDWVRANPQPTLLVTKDLETLAVNDAFAKLLTQLDLRAEALLRGPLTENGLLDAPARDLFDTLEKGNCVARHLTVADSQYYTFHLIKLELTAAESCLCCMLVPEGELWNGQPAKLKSFEENQRSYIKFVLKRTDGKVSGRGGAATILKMNPQTLFSKMKKLGIKR